MNLCINPECQKPHNSDTTIFCQGCKSELLLDGRYRVVEELGQGGFGTTYEIIDVNGHPWVLKVLMDNHPKYVELFRQEAQVLTILKHHGIPKVDLDSYFVYFPQGREEPLHCLVMENDFGTVREVTNSYLEKIAAGEITGVVTQGYTPMEQMRGKAVLQSDFYALGGTLIYLLTAQNPSSFFDLTEDKLIWRDTVPQIAPEFADLIDRMMAFSPAKRPSNSREIFNQIIAIDPSLQVLDEHFNCTSIKSDIVDTKTSIKITSDTLDTKFNNTVNQSSNKSEDDLSFIANTASSTVFSSSLDPQITPEFIERCRQQLAEFIGPMASIVCKRTLQKNPNMTESELSLALAQTISNPKQAKDFQQRMVE